jgi:hypothetical protein
VIETAIIPQRRRQERRNTLIIVSLFMLVLASLSPYSVSSLIYNYFHVLGYSDEWTKSSLYLTCTLGVLVEASVIGLLMMFLPGRPGALLNGVAYRGVTTIAGVGLAVGLFALGIAFRASAVTADRSSYYVNVATKETLAGFSFNFSVVALSVALASSALLLQRVLRRWRTRWRATHA